MTRFIGIIGYPLKHTVSPVFQQAALDYYRLDVRYEVWETKAKDLAVVINQLRQPNRLGANITIPYKEAVLPFMDEVDDFASFAGAVNTVVNRGGKLAGFNTDGYGFIKSLREEAGFQPENKRAMIIGAGGAARAVSLVLLQEKIELLAIANRTVGRAESLADSLRKYASNEGINAEIIVLPCQGLEFSKTVKGCHLIVNCTSLGMKHTDEEGISPLTGDLIPRGALVYDLVYNPLITPLMRIAKEAGAYTLGGLHMLVYQGAASFKLWVGREAPVDIMLSAAKQALLKMGG